MHPKIPILSALESESITGPQLRQALKAKGLDVSAKGWANIYPHLRRMEDAGLIRSKRLNGTTKNANSYSITPRGRKELDVARKVLA